MDDLLHNKLSVNRKKYKTSGWNEMVEMSFQPLLTCFFVINTFICCVINHRICIQSYAMCPELA